MTVAPSGVDVREVGPRDGLQAEAPLSVADRVRLIQALFDAGLRHMEVCSFVSPKAVPSMADAAEVVAAVLPSAPVGSRLVALVPNLRGAELAVGAGVPELSVTVSASAEYNQRNVRMTIDESVDAISAICGLGLPVDAVVSCAFGSPYEGDIAAADVAELCRRLLGVGCSTLTLADTTGMATPRLVRGLVEAVGADVGLHLHETRGTGLVNAFAAFEAGVRRFDTSVGGLGGSPFAAGAAGNLATEDLLYLLDDLGAPTGVDLPALLSASELAASLIGHSVPSRVAAAGPRSRLAPA